MASTLGLDQPIGAAAAGEPTTAQTDLATLEKQLSEAKQSARVSRAAFETALRMATELEIKVMRARTEAAAEEIRAAGQVDRVKIDAAITDFREAIRAGASIVTEVGNSSGWGRGIEEPLTRAKSGATSDDLPGVVLVRGIDQTGTNRTPGVALFLDLTGTLPQPISTMTAGELARRAHARSR